MDISRVISDVGALTVKYPVKGEFSKHESNINKSSTEITIDKVETPQKQVAKIVQSAEELLKQKNSTESSSKDHDNQADLKGVSVDEYV